MAHLKHRKEGVTALYRSRGRVAGNESLARQGPELTPILPFTNRTFLGRFPGPLQTSVFTSAGWTLAQLLFHKVPFMSKKDISREL